jgi:hypothetical protein
MNEKPYQRIRYEIDLPPLTAMWVLGAHLFTMLSPLVMIAAILEHYAFLQFVMYSHKIPLIAGISPARRRRCAIFYLMPCW